LYSDHEYQDPSRKLISPGLFAEEVRISLFDSGTLQPHVPNILYVHPQVDCPEQDQFWQEYLVYTIFKNKATLQGHFHTIYRTALQLAERVGNSNPNTVRKYVSALCVGGPKMTLACGSEEQAKHLLKAAIINNEAAVVEQILQDHGTPSDILDDARDMWLPPLTLAGRSGSVRMLRALLSTRRFRALAEMREDALRGALHEGRFEVVAFICDPQWGPMNFVSGQIFGRSSASQTISCSAPLDPLLHRLLHDELNMLALLLRHILHLPSLFMCFANLLCTKYSSRAHIASKAML
jgi:hypothetical protein